MATLIEVVDGEATDIEREAAVAAHAHFLSGRRWDKVQFWLGGPGTILAAIAGVTAFTQGNQVMTGAIAIAAAAFSGLNTFLSPGDRAAAHRAANTSFNALRREASILRDVDARLAKDTEEGDIKQLADRLRQLSIKMSEAEHNAPSVTAGAKQKAEDKFSLLRSTT